MKLTALDLQQHQFKTRKFGGLDEAEVRGFLDKAAEEIEDLTRRLQQQDEEARRQAARIAEYAAREQLLHATLTTAQRMTEDLKAQARKEGEILLTNAELQAEKIIANAQAKRLQLVGEIEELKRAKAAFVSQLSAVIETHRSMLEAIRAEAVPPRVQVPQQGDNVSFLAPPGKPPSSRGAK
jgi:cell division initiation protein